MDDRPWIRHCGAHVAYSETLLFIVQPVNQFGGLDALIL